jgi:hypothetical protein
LAWLPWAWLPWVSLAAGPGCGPPPVKSLDNPDPSGKIPAIKAAADRHDRRAVPDLIQDLDDDDPAVRFYAALGLERITGDNFGYHYYDDVDQRQPAIRRWQKWWEEQSRNTNGPAKRQAAAPR